tara:strand:- start:216 stop:371 length:156 start_codon:yes stop_codon:yes gene_type:complete
MVQQEQHLVLEGEVVQVEVTEKQIMVLVLVVMPMHYMEEEVVQLVMEDRTE